MKLGICPVHGCCVTFDRDDALLRYGCRLCREKQGKRGGLDEIVDPLKEEALGSNGLIAEKEERAD